jgi:hypothetical protein
LEKKSVGITRLRSYTLPDGGNIPATICDAALATSATLSFFDPVSIGNRQYMDSSLVSGNPVDQVEEEAVNIWAPNTGDLKPLINCFVSIGTGIIGKKALEDSVTKTLHASLMASKMAMTADVESTAENFTRRWAKQHDLKRYFRFNVIHGLQDVGLAEYKEQGLIEVATYEYLQNLAVRYPVRDCVRSLQQKQCVYIEGFAWVTEQSGANTA